MKISFSHFKLFTFIQQLKQLAFPLTIVKLIEKSYGGKPYIFAEPTKEGRWSFGGTILYTSNGVYSEFNTPIKLHDRNMDLEK